LDNSLLANDAESLSVVEVDTEGISDHLFSDVDDHLHPKAKPIEPDQTIQPIVKAIKDNMALSAPRNFDSNKKRRNNFGNGKYDCKISIPPTTLDPISPSSPVTDSKRSDNVIRNILDGIMKKRRETTKTNKMRRKNRFTQTLHN
jgi:hypothetical protein